ncbi:MAG: HEAT repeat protein [Myxococcota bacterium]|jgi:HEAT repeat protein
MGSEARVHLTGAVEGTSMSGMLVESRHTGLTPGDYLAMCVALRQWSAGAPTSGDLSRLVAQEEALLQPLTVRLRLFALAGIGASATHGVGADARLVTERLAELEAQAHQLWPVVAEKARAQWLEELWQIAVEGRKGKALAAATSLALAGALPLSVERPAPIYAADDPNIVALLGVALGHAAAAGDPGALGLLRDVVSDADAPIGAAVGAIKGLGHGLWHQGLAKLEARSRHAVLGRDEWGASCRRATTLAPIADAGTRAILYEGLSSCETEDVADAFISELVRRVSARFEHDLVEDLRSRWTHWPGSVRAALVRIVAPERIASEWPYERHPAVLRRVLERLDEHATLPDDARDALLRRWADHLDRDVRRAVGRAASRASLTRQGPTEVLSQGDLLALPASRLAHGTLDRLLVALWSGESESVVALAEGVAEHSQAEAGRALLETIEVPNAALRRACVEAIGLLGDPAVGPELMAVARRFRALEGTVAAALRRLDARDEAEPLAELYRRRLKWADDEAVDDYCALAGPERIGHLRAALETRFYPSARAGAARALGRIRAHEAVFSLRSRGLSDTQEGARLAALEALAGLTGAAPSTDEIAGYALLFRPTAELPDAIQRAREAGPAGLPGIRYTLAKGSWKRRRAACEVLATVPGADAEAVLLDCLSDPDEDVRVTAVDGLEERGFRASTARDRTLIAVGSRRLAELVDASETLDEAAAEDALALGGHVFRSEVLAVLENLAGWTPSKRRAAFVEATRLDGAATLGCHDGLTALLTALDHTWQAVPHRGRLSVALFEVEPSLLAEALRSDVAGWRAREALCHALARPGDVAAANALADAVLDDDDDVRRAAFETLGQNATLAAAKVLAAGFSSPFQEDREFVARALSAVGDVGLEVVDRLMSDPWWENRQGAALTLSNWRGDLRVAANRLIVLAVDPEFRVCQPAREGLARHGVLPGADAVIVALEGAQAAMLEGLEPWLAQALAEPYRTTLAARLQEVFLHLNPNRLPQRLGIVAILKADPMRGWLEDLADRSSHMGIRLAAAETLRALARGACHACRGERSVGCPECQGVGETECEQCDGRGAWWGPCPDTDCTAQQVTRRIDSRRCGTCGGRGRVLVPCICGSEKGRVTCRHCHGQGRVACIVCEGSGHRAVIAVDSSA